MSAGKIKVPDGMYEAAMKHQDSGIQCSVALEAALRWLSENPIVPTDDQMRWIHFRNCENSNIKGHCDAIVATCVEWQRRMFLEQETAIPEEIKDLLWKQHPDETWRGLGENHNKEIIEAFNRGLRHNSHRKEQ